MNQQHERVIGTDAMYDTEPNEPSISKETPFIDLQDIDTEPEDKEESKVMDIPITTEYNIGGFSMEAAGIISKSSTMKHKDSISHVMRTEPNDKS